MYLQEVAYSQTDGMYLSVWLQVVAWLLGRGEETLARHQTLADTLTGITRQEAEFHKFYTVATVSTVPVSVSQESPIDVRSRKENGQVYLRKENTYLLG